MLQPGIGGLILVTRLFPWPKRHLLGGATEKTRKVRSVECWDTPSTTKSTWENYVGRIRMPGVTNTPGLFARAFFHAKELLWSQNKAGRYPTSYIHLKSKAHKKSFQPWRPLQAHRLSNKKVQCHYKRPIIAAKVWFSISTQDIVHSHCGCVRSNIKVTPIVEIKNRRQYLSCTTIRATNAVVALPILPILRIRYMMISVVRTSLATCGLLLQHAIHVWYDKV